jgi:hypothetical protein
LNRGEVGVLYALRGVGPPIGSRQRSSRRS